MKKPEEMTRDELRAQIGFPPGCPPEIERAWLVAAIERRLRSGNDGMMRPEDRRLLEHLTQERVQRALTKAGIEAVQAAARVQAGWSPAQKEAARLASLRAQGLVAKVVGKRDA